MFTEITLTAVMTKMDKIDVHLNRHLDVVNRKILQSFKRMIHITIVISRMFMDMEKECLVQEHVLLEDKWEDTCT